MILENYNFAIKLHSDSTYTVLVDVVYESPIGVPSELVGFETMEELNNYATELNLAERVETNTVDLNIN